MEETPQFDSSVTCPVCGTAKTDTPHYCPVQMPNRGNDVVIEGNQPDTSPQAKQLRVS
jgi:hypothetical protein